MRILIRPCIIFDSEFLYGTYWSIFWIEKFAPKLAIKTLDDMSNSHPSAINDLTLDNKNIILTMDKYIKKW